MVTTAAQRQESLDDVPPELGERAGGHSVVEAVVAAVIAGLGLLVMQLALRPDAAPDSVLIPTLGALAAPWAACMLALAATGYFVAGSRYAHMIIAALAGAAASLLTVPLTVGLWGTDQPMGAVLGGDNAFRTEYVTRFASSWKLQDYMFAGEHPFYPPAWFWAVGRWADAVGADPWRMLQPAVTVTQALSLVAAFVLWRLTTRPATALAAAIASSVMISQLSSDVTPVWYSPYSAFVAVVLVPWFVAAHAYVSGPRARYGRVAVLIGTGAVLALTYYLLFVIAMVALAVLVAPAAIRRTPAWRRLLLLMTGVAVLTAVFWVPLALDLLSGTATQGTYFAPEFLDVDTGLTAGTATALITIMAVVLLLLTVRAPASRALISLGVSVILYQVVSAFLLAVAHQHLQPHRAATLLWATMAAALPVTWELITRADGPRPDGVLLAGLGHRVRIAGAALAFLPMLSVASDFAAPMFAGELVQRAHPDFDHAGPDAIHRSITNAAGVPAQDLVVASADSAVLVVHPFWGFVPWNIHYAHPQARVPERVQFLQQAASCPDATCFDEAMAASPFGHIDAFVLRRDPAGQLSLGTQLPGFPEPEPVTIAFDPDLFAPGRWTSHDVAGYAVYVATR